MTLQRGRVLVVDDKANMLGLLRQILAPSHEVETASDGVMALRLLENQTFDVVLTDVRMPGADGFEIVRVVKQRWPSTEVILMTAFASVETAVEAIRQGAYDYLPKPFDPDDVNLVVARALERKRLGEQAEALPGAAARAHHFSKLIGESAAMQTLFAALARAAALDVPVLLTGEPGSGKELAALAVHENSRRKSGPFVPVDCGALAADALDKQLLGSEAESWAKAAGGTLFLNEIEELPAASQIVLARRLEDPVGKRDARVIAGCDLDVPTATKSGRVRPELVAQLAVLTAALPPLRERGGDIPLLAQHFLARFTATHRPIVEGFQPEVLAALLAYDWPDNVRELRSVVERAAASAPGRRIALTDLPFDLRQGPEGGAEAELASLTYREALIRARDRASREYLVALMRAHGGRVTQAAAAARIERESLHRLLKRYNVRAEAYREPGAAPDDK